MYNHPVLEYILLVFGGSLGVLQIAAAAGGFGGLRFFTGRLVTYLIGFAIAGGTYIWFFETANLKMNANPANRPVQGLQQLCYFLLGSFLALIVTWVISSLINTHREIGGEVAVTGEGIEDLKRRNVLEAFAQRWKNRRRNG